MKGAKVQNQTAYTEYSEEINRKVQTILNNIKQKLISHFKQKLSAG